MRLSVAPLARLSGVAKSPDWRHRRSAMSDGADLSRVLALTHKSCELRQKGHNMRAAEKYSRAVEEAEKTLFPDCLVTCLLRHEHLDCLLCHATSPTALADADDALREACLLLLPSVMAVLDRRKAAGTLLPGSCRPVEEAFQKAAARLELELQGCTQADAAESAAALAPYVGLETYFCVAANVAYMVNNTNKGALARAFVLSDEQKHTAYLFVADALDLMARPRDFDTWLAGEPGLVRELRGLIPALSDMHKPALKKLRAAWRRMLRSGVLRARGIDEGIDLSHERHLRISAALDAEVAAGLLQPCALEGCAASESHASQFKRCGACRTVCYCCKEHQVADWASHKAACKAARKVADPSGDQ